jgi:phenylacetic acid degradation operon negative regulatory protein
LQLAAYVDLFRADYLAFGDIGKLAAQWWDLGELRDDYRRFMSTYQQVLGSATSPQRAFADWVNALTAWRRLPYRDPGLPVELLPADWPGYAARQLFETLRGQLSVPALDYVTRLLEAGRSAD